MRAQQIADWRFSKDILQSKGINTPSRMKFPECEPVSQFHHTCRWTCRLSHQAYLSYQFASSDGCWRSGCWGKGSPGNHSLGEWGLSQQEALGLHKLLSFNLWLEFALKEETKALLGAHWPFQKSDILWSLISYIFYSFTMCFLFMPCGPFLCLIPTS